MKENNRFGDNTTKLFFEYKNGIFYTKTDAIHIQKRSVILKSMELEIYEYIYDQFGYPSYKRTHERLSANFYIFNMIKNLYAYLYYYH